MYMHKYSVSKGCETDFMSNIIHVCIVDVGLELQK